MAVGFLPSFMANGNTGGKAVPANRSTSLSGGGYAGSYGSSSNYGAGTTVASGFGGGGGTGAGNYGSGGGGGIRGAVQSTLNRVQGPPPPVATPVTADPNYVTGPTAYNNEQVAGGGMGTGVAASTFNPFAPTPGEELQRYLLGQGITSQTALNGAHGNLLNAQERNLNAQYGFTGREGDLKLQGAAADRAYIDKSRLNIDQLRQLYGEQKANEIAGLNQRADVNRRDINSKATEAGAFLFPGRGQHINDVNNDLANATQNSELSFRDKLLSLDNRGNELDNRNAKLDLIGQEVGLDRDKARAALDFGLAQLGYDRYVDSNKLLDMLNSGKAQEQAITNQILERVLKTGAEYQNGNVGDLYKQHTTTRWGINTGGN
jgi:hypothetical protein